MASLFPIGFGHPSFTQCLVAPRFLRVLVLFTELIAEIFSSIFKEGKEVTCP